MKITIEQAMNGYVVTYPDYVGDVDGVDKEASKSIVVEEDEDDECGEQAAFVSLCWKIHELFSRWKEEPQTVTGYPSVNYNAATSGQVAFLATLAQSRSH